MSSTSTAEKENLSPWTVNDILIHWSQSCCLVEKIQKCQMLARFFLFILHSKRETFANIFDLWLTDIKWCPNIFAGRFLEAPFCCRYIIITSLRLFVRHGVSPEDSWCKIKLDYRDSVTSAISTSLMWQYL